MQPNNPTVVATREPTWAGLGELVLAIKAAQEHPTRKVKRLPMSEIVGRDRAPEATLLESYKIIQKVGNAATDFPIGYILTPLGLGYAHDLATSAVELFEKRFPPAQQPAPEEKLHL